MTEQERENKQLVRRFYEKYYNSKDFAAAGELLSENVINRHDGIEIIGKQAMLDDFRHNAETFFPNFHLDVRRVVAEGDQVWTHGLITGLPEDAQSVRVDIWRIHDGKIAEHWDVQQPVEPGKSPDAML